MRWGTSGGMAYGVRMSDAAPQHPPHATAGRPPQYAPPPARRGGRTFAILALVVAGLEVLTGPLMVLVLSGAIRAGLDPSGIGLLSGGVGALSAVLGAIAAALAIVSILRREPARVLAGIALGIAISALASLIASALQVVLFSF
ncbi:hypothetical protein L332_08375 [Agrococcus pavilionensis RW1]|uniref:Uncharacterized protein n=2 Tax=Agrococcus TaxID=46352 RepID=U1LPV9_9MICO|nr:hypothetical protein L332_08375 [Agrococcus pavilionensis RW1]